MIWRAFVIITASIVIQDTYTFTIRTLKTRSRFKRQVNTHWQPQHVQAGSANTRKGVISPNNNLINDLTNILNRLKTSNAAAVLPNNNYAINLDSSVRTPNLVSSNNQGFYPDYHRIQGVDRSSNVGLHDPASHGYQSSNHATSPPGAFAPPVHGFQPNYYETQSPPDYHSQVVNQHNTNFNDPYQRTGESYANVYNSQNSGFRNYQQSFVPSNIQGHKYNSNYPTNNNKGFALNQYDVSPGYVHNIDYPRFTVSLNTHKQNQNSLSNQYQWTTPLSNANIGIQPFYLAGHSKHNSHNGQQYSTNYPTSNIFYQNMQNQNNVTNPVKLKNFTSSKSKKLINKSPTYSFLSYSSSNKSLSQQTSQTTTTAFAGEVEPLEIEFEGPPTTAASSANKNINGNSPLRYGIPNSSPANKNRRPVNIISFGAPNNDAVTISSNQIPQGQMNFQRPSTASYFPESVSSFGFSWNNRNNQLYNRPWKNRGELITVNPNRIRNFARLQAAMTGHMIPTTRSFHPIVLSADRPTPPPETEPITTTVTSAPPPVIISITRTTVQQPITTKQQSITTLTIGITTLQMLKKTLSTKSRAYKSGWIRFAQKSVQRKNSPSRSIPVNTERHVSIYGRQRYSDIISNNIKQLDRSTLNSPNSKHMIHPNIAYYKNTSLLRIDAGKPKSVLNSLSVPKSKIKLPLKTSPLRPPKNLLRNQAYRSPRRIRPKYLANINRVVYPAKSMLAVNKFKSTTSIPNDIYLENSFIRYQTPTYYKWGMQNIRGNTDIAANQPSNNVPITNNLPIPNSQNAPAETSQKPELLKLQISHRPTTFLRQTPLQPVSQSLVRPTFRNDALQLSPKHVYVNKQYFPPLPLDAPPPGQLNSFVNMRPPYPIHRARGAISIWPQRMRRDISNLSRRQKNFNLPFLRTLTFRLNNPLNAASIAASNNIVENPAVFEKNPNDILRDATFHKNPFTSKLKKSEISNIGELYVL